MKVKPLAMTGRFACHTLAHPGLNMNDPGMNSPSRTWTSKDARGHMARARDAKIARRAKARKAKARAKATGRCDLLQ